MDHISERELEYLSLYHTHSSVNDPLDISPSGVVTDYPPQGAAVCWTPSRVQRKLKKKKKELPAPLCAGMIQNVLLGMYPIGGSSTRARTLSCNQRCIPPT